MSLRFQNQIGKLTDVETKADGTIHRFEIAIFDGNCDAVFNYTAHDSNGNEVWQLWMFWDGAKHRNTMARKYGNIFCGARVENIRLNLYYPTAMRVLKILNKAGYKVTCYNKAPKK